MSNLKVENIQSILETQKEKDCKYTQAEIDEMKIMGMAKPKEVSWGLWCGAKDHSHRHDLLMHMAACGATNNQIASDLGMTAGRISILLSQPAIKKKIRALQTEYWGDNAKKRFETILPKAIDIAEDILVDPQEKSTLRADVAFRLMDRALGKPNQTTTIEGNLLSELLIKIDLEKKELKDVTPQNSLEKPPDKLDTFVDSFIDAEVSVGKKVINEEPAERSEGGEGDTDG